MKCIKCSSNQAYKQQIDRFNYITCPSCGYSITAKHYRAKLAENKNPVIGSFDENGDLI